MFKPSSVSHRSNSSGWEITYNVYGLVPSWSRHQVAIVAVPHKVRKGFHDSFPLNEIAHLSITSRNLINRAARAAAPVTTQI